jgi:5-formyltetrahydrofolate cyclo-ligase
MMKDRLRREILALRKGFRGEDLKQHSTDIRKNLESLPEFKKAKRICFYISFENEPETHALIADSLKNGKTVIIPYVDRKEIFLSELKDFSELEKGKFGILEPAKKFIRPADVSGLDLIVMPGIVFDRKGHRIGFGEGYYDKLLARSNVKKVALAYDFQIVESIPAEVHDVPVDMIVTEKGVTRFDN